MPKLNSSHLPIIAANLAALALALIFGWELRALVWGFWLQSVFLGILAAAKPVYLATRMKTGWWAAVPILLFIPFFLSIFLFAHAIYMLLLIYLPIFGIGTADLGYGLVMAAVMSIASLFAYAKEVEKKARETEGNLGIGTGGELVSACIEPYAALLPRILPMHAIIMAAAFASGFLTGAPYGTKAALISIFMAAKTYAEMQQAKEC